MPVPNSIADLSKNAADNSPAGTESAKGTIDDYFRAHASFIKQLFDQLLGQSVVLPSAATVNVGFAAATNIIITGTTQISAFDAWPEGTMRWITFAGAMILKHNSGSFQLPAAADLGTSAGDVAVFKSLGNGNWKCMAYQRASGTGPIKASATRDGYLSAEDWNAFANKYPANNPNGYISGVNSTMVVNALGFLPLSPLGNASVAGDFDARAIAARAGAGSEGGRLYMNRAVDNASVHFWQAFGDDAKPSVRLVTPDGQVLTISSIGDMVSRSHTSTSDERLKKKWRRRPAEFLQRISELVVGDFLWKKDGTPGIGTPAQKLEAIWPEAVHTDARGFKSVNYGAAAFVIAVELARAFFAYVAKTDKRVAKLERGT